MGSRAVRGSGAALALAVLVGALLCGCSSGESGTVSPTVQQAKPGSRGTR